MQIICTWINFNLIINDIRRDKLTLAVLLASIVNLKKKIYSLTRWQFVMLSP